MRRKIVSASISNEISRYAMGRSILVRERAVHFIPDYPYGYFLFRSMGNIISITQQYSGEAIRQ